MTTRNHHPHVSRTIGEQLQSTSLGFTDIRCAAGTVRVYHKDLPPPEHIEVDRLLIKDKLEWARTHSSVIARCGALTYLEWECGERLAPQQRWGLTICTDDRGERFFWDEAHSKREATAMKHAILTDVRLRYGKRIAALGAEALQVRKFSTTCVPLTEDSNVPMHERNYRVSRHVRSWQQRIEALVEQLEFTEQLQAIAS